MDGETEPPAGGLGVLTIVWLALTAGLLVLTAVLGWVRAGDGGPPPLDPPELGYAFLLAVPAALAAAFVVLPAAARLPAADTPDAWFPAHQAGLITRLAVLEGAGTLTAFGFFLSGLWPVLIGPVVVLAAMIALKPSRAGYTDWVEAVRRRSGV